MKTLFVFMIIALLRSKSLRTNFKRTRLLTLTFYSDCLNNDENHPMKSQNQQDISDSLKNFLEIEIQTALAKRNTGNEESIKNISKRIIIELTSNSIYSKNNKIFHDSGSKLVKSISLMSNKKLKNLLDQKSTIESIVSQFNEELEQNKKIFTDITTHHQSITDKNWGEISQNQTMLETYSQAAVAMGQKQWVVESIKWMENFTIDFFRHGGASRHYVKRFSEKSNENQSSVEQRTQLKALLKRDLKEPLESGQKPTRIKVLDVGSCYNPFLTMDPDAILDVTALDLFPTHPSVLQCDFLELNVGTPESIPIIETVDNTCGTLTYTSEGVTQGVVQKRRLLKLPEASFDAVTMSLVLSYLPHPNQREEMIKKARKLLQCGFVMKNATNIEKDENPHNTGILVIVEKESVFGKDNQRENGVGFNKSELVNQWKESICSMGFELIKYNLLKVSSTSFSHVFAFAAVPLDSIESSAYNKNLTKSRMWIKQDFDREKNTKSQDILWNNTPSKPAKREASRQKTLPVGIVGGGLGGCALALSLQRREIPYILYEKDHSFTARKQGYALTMQQGGTALRLLGLGDKLQKTGVVSTAHRAIRWDGEVLGAYGASVREGRVVGKEQEQLENGGFLRDSDVRKKKKKVRYNIHIPRQKVREMLLEDLNPSFICWGKQLLRFEEINDAEFDSESESTSVSQKKVILYFTDGTSEEVCLLVGADGIHSTVRTQLCSDTSTENTNTLEGISLNTSHKLNYLGLMVVLGISDTPSLLPVDPVSKVETKRFGQTQWLDGNTRVFTMPFDQNRTMWQLSFPMSEFEALDLVSSVNKNTDGTSCNTLKDRALQQLQGWDPELLQLIHQTSTGLVTGHPVYDRDPQLPVPPDPLNVTHGEGEASELWETGSPSVTLIGDAAHPMSPFKGQGANQAILDALSVSKAIMSSSVAHRSRRPLGVALREYEREMVRRSNEKVERSRAAAVFLHSPAALAVANVTRAKAAEDFIERNSTLM